MNSKNTNYYSIFKNTFNYLKNNLETLESRPPFVFNINNLCGWQILAHTKFARRKK